VRQVVKAAVAARILADGQTWIDITDHRNLLSQTCDPVNFEPAVVAIDDRYLATLGEGSRPARPPKKRMADDLKRATRCPLPATLD
jgi:hypothetical protein